MEEAKLDAHSDWVRDVAWAPSVGLKRQLIASCSQDRRVIIWANDGTGTSWTPHELPTFSDVIWHVSWAVTGNILAVSGGDNKVSEVAGRTSFPSDWVARKHLACSELT